jgi:hypothetical protein
MAKTKFVWINDTAVGYCTSAKVSPETNTTETKTFDGVITDGTSEVSWTVEFDKVRYGGISDYVAIEKLLHKMFTTPMPIKIMELAQTKEGEIRVTQIIYNCIVDNKEYSIDAEDRTVESLSFKGSKMREWVNSEEIPF